MQRIKHLHRYLDMGMDEAEDGYLHVPDVDYLNLHVLVQYVIFLLGERVVQVLTVENYAF